MLNHAKWICAPTLSDESACPLFQKTVSVTKKVKKAQMQVTALGIYNLFVNDKRIGKALFAPGWTSYHNRVQYQTYDVTDAIKDGDNTVAIHCANGWAVGFLGNGECNHIFFDHISTIGTLTVTYEDGSEEIVSTDATWDVYINRILNSEFYHGETVDFGAKAS